LGLSTLLWLLTGAAASALPCYQFHSACDGVVTVLHASSCPAPTPTPPSLAQWAQLLRLELHYEEAHESIASAHGPYYYLSFIGTAPEARGRGLGSKLLAEITARADREGRWCLLEATSKKSEVSCAGVGGKSSMFQ
jgi:hypothetical protein